MSRLTQQDLFVIRMSIETLLESVRQSETWWRACGDNAALIRAQQLGSLILATRGKFFVRPSNADMQLVEARVVAEGLREAARQCKEGQAALQTHLMAAADVIERLCQSRRKQS